MASLETYLAYKRDTSRLVFWIVKTSNSVIAASSARPSEDGPREHNSTGQVTVSSLVALAKLIADHIDSVPSAILGLFDSVIRARTAAYESFQAYAASRPNPDVERSNASHKHFIDALCEAFDALGGATWRQKDRAKAKAKAKAGPASTSSPPDDDDDDDDSKLEEVLLSNKFAALDIERGQQDGGSSDESDPESPSPAQSQQTKSSGKAKKGKWKKGKKSKEQQRRAQAADAHKLEGVPIESYRIVQDEEGILTDYLIAIHFFIFEWAEIRHSVQTLWRDVAYEGLNSAIAGAVSNVAINMVKRSAIAIFVDFPGHDSFETITNAATKGDPDKVQGIFGVSVSRPGTGVGPAGGFGEPVVENAVVDVKEQFLIYTYRALVDFIIDFRKTRSGKPTRPMLAQLRGWDPNLNLQAASAEQRLEWRRSFTINWLYDLVNLLSSPVVECNKKPGGHRYALESVDWSPSGPWAKHRRLYGLNEFAGVVTRLAMQKQGAEFASRIMPHHVFQLQCIVDSLTVSRGWGLSGMKGHILSPPPPDFQARRDIEMFLDRKYQRFGQGVVQAVSNLKYLLQKDDVLHKIAGRHGPNVAVLHRMLLGFFYWLGDSGYERRPPGIIPPSRFSNSNPNGLWEYSPFLCGVGLADALTETYCYSVLLMDRILEPILLVHLQNMLVQKGYLPQTFGLCGLLRKLFRDAAFDDDIPPTTNFFEAARSRVTQMCGRRLSLAHLAAQGAPNLSANELFKHKSLIMALGEAGWDPDRIPDCDLHYPSTIALRRIWQTKHIVDPSTGEKRMDDTQLVKRARSYGVTDKAMMSLDDIVPSHASKGRPVLDFTTPGPAASRQTTTRRPKPGKGTEGWASSNQGRLHLMRLDISTDVCGETAPLSGLNFPWILGLCIMHFQSFELELKQLRDPSYIKLYEREIESLEWCKQKRMRLILYNLHAGDEVCLKAFAQVFVKLGPKFENNNYWSRLDFSARNEYNLSSKECDIPDQCVAM